MRRRSHDPIVPTRPADFATLVQVGRAILGRAASEDWPVEKLEHFLQKVRTCCCCMLLHALLLPARSLQGTLRVAVP